MGTNGVIRVRRRKDTFSVVSATVRALFATLLVAVVAFGGALYIGYHRGLSAAENRADASGRIASLDLRDLFGPQVVDEQLVGLAFRQVERVYYRPVDAQT